MSSQFHRVIGIDLGTTYSAVAAYNENSMNVEIIGNPESDDPETTASVVSLDPMLRKAIVGSAAKRNLAVRPHDTVSEIKREMGELFNDETQARYNPPPELLATSGDGSDKRAPLKVPFAGAWMLPQEISAFILMKMKQVAEREIGEEIRDAVVTVPAYFTEKQRKATEEATLLAGLYPRQLLPEPTAAAICYGVDRMETDRKTYLVYDLGGGTFDVSIIRVEGAKQTVLATSGDPRLGGADFDEAINQWAVAELLKRGVDLRNDRANQARIKDRAEFAKKALSFAEKTTLDLAFLRNLSIPNLDLTRAIFLELIEPLLRKSLSYVDRALDAAASQKGLNRNEIDAILLVGGSSKIPHVKSLLLDYFQKDENFVRTEVNADTVVARGAAIIAHQFAPTPGPFDIRRRKEATLINTEANDVQDTHMITEHSLGIGIDHGQVSRVVDQGTSIPIECRKGGFTNSGTSPYIPVPVFQGEGKFHHENTLIGTLQIGPMEPKPAGFHQFEVVFNLDKNGLLNMKINHLNETKTYEAHFDQKTGVGGDEALIAFRNRLLAMYAGSQGPSARDYEPPPPPQPATWPGGYPWPEQKQSPPAWNPAVPDARQPGGYTAPAHVPSPGSHGYSGGPPPGAAPYPLAGTMPGPAAPPPNCGPVGTALPASGPAAVASATAPAAQVAQIPPTGEQTAIPGLIEPLVPVPEQFKQVVRRSRKQLTKNPDLKLLAALNAFIDALNRGVGGVELEDIGDDLADRFDAARE